MGKIWGRLRTAPISGVVGIYDITPVKVLGPAVGRDASSIIRAGIRSKAARDSSGPNLERAIEPALLIVRTKLPLSSGISRLEYSLGHETSAALLRAMREWRLRL